MQAQSERQRQMGQAAAVQQQAACYHTCANIKYGHDRHAGTYARLESSSAQQCVLQQRCAARRQLRARGCARRAGARSSASSCPSAKNAAQSICCNKAGSRARGWRSVAVGLTSSAASVWITADRLRSSPMEQSLPTRHTLQTFRHCVTNRVWSESTHTNMHTHTRGVGGC